MDIEKDKFARWAASNVTGAQANIVLFLSDKERSKTSMAKELDMPRPTIDRVFGDLLDRGLVKFTKQVGREKFYTSILPPEVIGGN